jgi:tetratricopeptide (TPR) repeat protein
MIVKDEARVIRRCLDSVKPFIDHWVIVDTGSTDGTQDVIRAHMQGIPGEVHDRPWRGFAASRSEALALAKAHGDYTLVLDADEQLLVDPGFRLPPLVAGEYLFSFRMEGSSTSWYRTTLLRAELGWRYEGVVHEYATCDVPHEIVRVAKGISVRSYFDSARNVDPKQKFLRDAETLTQALATDPENSRYVFYLAQSYFDAGELEKSLVQYERRARMAGFEEEAYVALDRIAAIKLRMGLGFEHVIAAYLRAYERRPTRAESLVSLAAACRERGEWAHAEMFARTAMSIPRPDDLLFVDDSTYIWRAADELCVATYWRGKYEESAQLARKLLDDPRLPPDQRARVQKNLEFNAEKLGARPIDAAARRDKNAEKRKRQGRR